MALTTKELDQILSAVGMKSVPRDLNRDKLCKDLDRAAIWFRTAAKLHTSKVKLHNKLNQTAKTAGRLQNLLANNGDEAWLEISEFYPAEAHDPKEIVGLLVKAVDKRLLLPPAEPAWKTSIAKRMVGELTFNERSAFEWLAGQQLRKLFNRHFKSKASARNAKGLPDTPYLRFAIGAIRALRISHNGKPYSPESIVRAMTSVSTGKKRRRG